MSSPNPFISNGTCYFAANKKSDPGFIPCGNDAVQRQSCCYQGDNCLASRACFNSNFGVTYLAGCSDPDYADDACPDKADLADLPWTGLVYCNGTSEQWMACNQSGKPALLRKGDFCFCPRDESARRVVFRDKNPIENIASLPPRPGSSIRFEAGHIPTVPPGASTPIPSSTGESDITWSIPTETGAVETGAAAAAESSDVVLTTGQKAGIGAGVALAGLLALGAALFLLLRRRRAGKAAAEDEKYNNDHGGFGAAGHEGKALGPGGGNHLSVPNTPSMMSHTPVAPNTPALSELDAHAARPWSLRSELHGNENLAVWDGQRQDGMVTPEQSPQMQQQYTQYRPYRPPADGSGMPVLPIPGSLMPGGGGLHVVNGGQCQGVRPGGLSPVHELP